MATVDTFEWAQDVPATAWDACAGSANPFVAHAFFDALETSGSAVPETGWTPRHLALRKDGAITGLLPGYIKTHSQGEYVFDHNWADAFARAGGRYYPKWQLSVPFSPVPGPRLLGAGGSTLLAAATAEAARLGLSSIHATFIEPAQVPVFEEAGFLIRQDQQFHWHNRGYAGFDDFLAGLSSRKRKAIRKERAQAVAPGIRFRRVTGAALGEADWDAFWHFYQDTGARKWGRPYLSRRFFSLLGERMADRVLLIFAERDGRPVAGALNLIGRDALYGRYWGCIEDHPCLHFETCYYQAIDFAIDHGLARVEAGAQGPHKLARGYEPVATWSAHWIAHPGFRAAVADFLERERAAVTQEIAYLGQFTPYRRGPGPGDEEDHD